MFSSIGVLAQNSGVGYTSDVSHDFAELECDGDLVFANVTVGFYIEKKIFIVIK